MNTTIRQPNKKCTAAIAGWTAAFWAICCCAPLAAQQETAASAVGDVYKKSQSAKTVDDYSGVIAGCQEAAKLQLDEQNAEYIRRLQAWAHNRRGEAYVEQAGQRTEAGSSSEAAKLDALALEDFEAAAGLDPDNWKALHNRGVSNALAQKLDEAVADFSRVIELKRDYVNAWFNRAEIYYELNQNDKAIADYNEVIRLAPEDFGAYTSRGHAHFEMRNFQQAFADYNRAVELQPNSAEARANRGDAYSSVGEWEQAAADYRRAIRLDDENARAYQSAAWLMATCPDENYRDAQLALQAAERAVSLAGDDDYKYLDTLAAAQANAQQFDEAQKTLAQAIEKAPDTQAEPLRQRLALYKNSQPYRIELKSPSGQSGE